MSNGVNEKATVKEISAFPYKNMLGYKKGEDGEPEVVPEEAEHIKNDF